MSSSDVKQIIGGLLILAILFAIDRARRVRRVRDEAQIQTMRQEPGFDQRGLRPERIIPTYTTYASREEEIVFNVARALVKLLWIYVKWSITIVIGGYVAYIMLILLISFLR